MSVGKFIILLAIVLGIYDIINKTIKIIEWHIKYDIRPINERRTDKWYL